MRKHPVNRLLGHQNHPAGGLVAVAARTGRRANGKHLEEVVERRPVAAEEILVAVHDGDGARVRKAWVRIQERPLTDAA